MKKVFFLIAFLFTVVCFAAPPPDLPTVSPVEDVGFFQSQEVTVDFCFDVRQEVAFAYIGNSCNLFMSKATSTYYLMLPDAYTANGVITNGNLFCDKYDYLPNLQNSNYAYPFGADYLV